MGLFAAVKMQDAHLLIPGVLKMTDESGDDAKILAVPIDKLCSLYREARDIHDMPAGQRVTGLEGEELSREIVPHCQTLEPPAVRSGETAIDRGIEVE